MRYTGSTSNLIFKVKSGRSLRNEQYINLPEPDDVPDELLFFEHEYEENSVKIISGMLKKYPLTIDEATALRYAIKCIEGKN